MRYREDEFGEIHAPRAPRHAPGGDADRLSGPPWWPRRRWPARIAAVLVGVALFVVLDMLDRGVPFTRHGLQWWMSLWTGP